MTDVSEDEIVRRARALLAEGASDLTILRSLRAELGVSLEAAKAAMLRAHGVDIERHGASIAAALALASDEDA